MSSRTENEKAGKAWVLGLGENEKIVGWLGGVVFGGKISVQKSVDSVDRQWLTVRVPEVLHKKREVIGDEYFSRISALSAPPAVDFQQLPLCLSVLFISRKMAAIEKRGAFTDLWGREFLSDGTPLVTGKEGEGQDQMADDDNASEDQLSEDKKEKTETGGLLSKSTTGTGKTLPKIKLKLTPNFDGPESEEETGGIRPEPTTTTANTPQINTGTTTATPINTLGGKTLPTTKTKAKEVLSTRDPPCWRCKSLNKPCESSSLRFSCTTCYKRHWACSMNPPPPRQKKGHGGGAHSAPVKTRSLPAVTNTGMAIDTGTPTAESVSIGPITRGRSPLRSASAKSVKRPRSSTLPPGEDGDGTGLTLESEGAASSGVSAPLSKKTRTSLRTIVRPQTQYQPPPQSQPQPKTQPLRSQSKINGGGSSTALASASATNQGSVRPISIPPVSQTQTQIHLQSQTQALSQTQSSLSQPSTQTITVSESELIPLKSQIDTLIQREEQSWTILERHSAMLDALLGNMRVLLGTKFVDVGGKDGASTAHLTINTNPGNEGRSDGQSRGEGKASVLSTIYRPPTVAQDAEMEELDELDELTPIENVSPSLLPSSIPSSSGPVVNGHGRTASTATSKPASSIPPPSTNLIGPAVSGSGPRSLDSQSQSQRVERPPRIISVPPVRALATGAVAGRGVSREASQIGQASTPTWDSAKDSSSMNNLPPPPSAPSSSADNPNYNKPKPKPKAKNPYPTIHHLSSTPSPPPFPAPHPSSRAPASVPAPAPVHTAVPRDNSPRSILLPSGTGSGSGSARLEHSHAPVPPYRSRTSSSGPNIPPNINIPAISTLPIPTISSLPATATAAATPLSPASTTSVGDGDEDGGVDPVIRLRYGADTALTHPRPRITQDNPKQSVPKSHNYSSHPSRYLSRSPPIAHSRPPHNEIRQRPGSRSPSPPIHRHGYDGYDKYADHHDDYDVYDEYAESISRHRDAERPKTHPMPLTLPRPRPDASEKTKLLSKQRLSVPVPPSDKFSSSRPVSKRFQKLSPPPESSSSSQPVPHTRNSSDMQIDSLVGNEARPRPTDDQPVRSDLVNLDLEDMEEEVGQDRQSDYEGDMEGDSVNRDLGVVPAIVDRQVLEVQETATGAEGGGELGLEYPVDVASNFGDVVGTRGTVTEDKLSIPDTAHVG
ncbi:hypothetical protein F5050DRAFT_1709267 [Lentinula boryana]|uniref:Zn(2)-C6 fungal-type domain-containing protein n=1 Tax=Lentinula boryana TaxID=40481 RepID=A0ABQ8QN41_9AGAR|nr:hypothetical protein F5050DRAFT_1709267 [Lentinula boryana]